MSIMRIGFGESDTAIVFLFFYVVFTLKSLSSAVEGSLVIWVQSI